ncbi:response regulator transcription factor [Actinoallomurus rhizosphaericola]|uniref:response regulator transcription factor n=1 Tax=Actinoallomurus rhizosphaericola TaxID=2952536 RepID=UPI002091A79C|nr:response regulator transcription factor [Actinoallomurus rhizosphaericola]MCO5991794.1 response regulator transcription factor [Actinoallomurus rhizosphaericola]
MIHVAVIDAHPIARCGIEHALESVADMAVVASVADVEDLQRLLVEGLQVDVVVFDPYLDGEIPAIDAVAKLAATRVLIMSTSARPPDVVAAIRAGASGYLTKRCDTSVLIAGLRIVAGGGFLLCDEIADVAHTLMVTSDAGRPRLSPREDQTLRMLARGLTHSQIATQLGVRKSTVDTYVERIRAKLGVGNKAELARAAMEREMSPRMAVW